MSTSTTHPTVVESYLSSWGTKFHAFAVKHDMELPHTGLIRKHFARDLGLRDQKVELHADGKLTSDGETIFNL